MLASSQASPVFPTASTAITGFSLPTAPVAVPMDTESIVGNLGITVTDVMFPADSYVGTETTYSVRDSGEHFLVVGIRVRCISADESCRLTEFDFGLETNSGQDFAAEFSSNFDVKNLFEGGEIQPGESMSGSLIFVIPEGESGLVLYYPRLFSFGGTAKFILGR